VVVTGVLILAVAGLPMDWLADLIDMSSREFRGFTMFIVFSALWLMHPIAASDSAP
jgi:hypothetical protein